MGFILAIQRYYFKNEQNYPNRRSSIHVLGWTSSIWEVPFNFPNAGEVNFCPCFRQNFLFLSTLQETVRWNAKEIRNIEFIGSLDFDFIENLPNDGTNYRLFFHDSCDEISRSKQFEKIAIAGRHRKLNCIYIQNSLFHESANGRDTELKNTHIVLFKSPRNDQQTDVLGKQLGLGNTLWKWYVDATSVPYGHSMIDLSPKTNDLLRYSTDVTSFPTEFYLPSSRSPVTQINDQKPGLLYSEAFSNLQHSIPEDFLEVLFQRFL